MKRKIIITALCLVIIIGGVLMAYWNEVSGKARTKTLLIGDGVDKTRSALQVSPSMATDMLNLSSKLYPTLSVRESLFLTGSLDHFPAPPEGWFITMCKPFVASNGDIHFVYINSFDAFALPDLYFSWWVLKKGQSAPTLKYSDHYGDSHKPTRAEEKYANGNFTEYKGRVYFSYCKTSEDNPLGTFTRILSYDTETSTITADGVGILVFYSDVLPIAVYLEKLFVASGSLLSYSKTYDFSDFTTAQNSGSIPLAQGGNITSLTPMRDRLFISTETSLFVMMGSSWGTFQVILLSDNIGIINPKCITSKNGIVYFSSTNGDIYEYDGNELLNIKNEPMETGSRSGVRGGFESSEFKTTSISTDDNVLYCVALEKSEGIKTYCFDLIKRRWYIHKYESLIEEPSEDFYSVTKGSVVFQNNNLQYFLFYQIEDEKMGSGKPTRQKVKTNILLTGQSTTKANIPFTWVSPAYQLIATGKQALKCIHLTYVSPIGTQIGVYISNSVDGDDFVKIDTLPNSRNEQNTKSTIPIRHRGMENWIRIKFQGYGGIEIYNMTLEWRMLNRLQ